MDSRFTLKGTFSIYGKNFPIDMSLNWGSDGGIDPRIADFFVDAYHDAHQAHISEHEKMRQEREEAEIESRERAELKRLTEKYAQK